MFKNINILSLFDNDYKLVSINDDNHALIYVDDINAWEEDTDSGEYSESDDKTYKIVKFIVDSTQIRFSEEYEITRKYFGINPILRSYKDYDKILKVGSSIKDLFNFLESIDSKSRVYIPIHMINNSNNSINYDSNNESMFNTLLNREDLKLCYIDSGIAYFSNNENQWGDDWGDSPYEHNAGTPYKEDGYELYKIGFVSNIYEEPYVVFNGYSGFTVEKINKKFVPWLTPSNIDYEPIFAGVSIKEFKNMIEKSNGEISLPFEFKSK